MNHGWSIRTRWLSLYRSTSSVHGGGWCVSAPSSFSLPSQFSTGRWSWQCRIIFPFTAALQAGDRGTRALVGICGLGMTNVSLSLTHHCLHQPGVSEQLGANQLSVISDLSRSLVRCETPYWQAPAGVRRCGVLSAGPVDPSGTPARGGSHLYCSALNINMSLLQRGQGKWEWQLSGQCWIVCWRMIDLLT